MAKQIQTFTNQSERGTEKITIWTAWRLYVFQVSHLSPEFANSQWNWKFDDPPFEEGTTFLVICYGSGKYKTVRRFVTNQEKEKEEQELYRHCGSNADDPWELMFSREIS